MAEDDKTAPVTEGDKLLVDVREWLDKNGYVLEMQVAQLLSRRTGLLMQGARYTDPLEGKNRETDVYAVLTTRRAGVETHGIQLFIECKDTRAPWVCFEGPSTLNGAWTPTDRSAPDDCAECERIEDHLWRHGELDLPAVYAIREVSNGRGADHAVAAVNQAASAVLAAFSDAAGREEFASNGPHQDGDPIPTTGVPLVVTRSPLVACRLGADGETQLQRIDRAAVMVPRTDVPPGTEGILVEVINLEGVDAVLDRLESALDPD